jgi:hypothetical protein
VSFGRDWLYSVVRRWSGSLTNDAPIRVPNFSMYSEELPVVMTGREVYDDMILSRTVLNPDLDLFENLNV